MSPQRQQRNAKGTFVVVCFIVVRIEFLFIAPLKSVTRTLHYAGHAIGKQFSLVLPWKALNTEAVQKIYIKENIL